MSVTQPVRARGELPAQAELEELVALALTHAKSCGASAAEASVHVDTGLSVKVRMREVDTLEYQRDRGFGITVYFGTRKGSASSADFTPASIKETVGAACTIARYTAEDPCQGLADAQLMPDELPDLDLYHPWPLDAEAAIELARECEAAALDADPRIDNSDGADVSSHTAVRVYGNSHGFIGGYRGSRHGLSCVSVARDNDQMQRDYWYTTARHPAELEAAAQVGARAAERTLRRLGARRLGTASVPVLFVPEVARGLLGHFVAAVRGGAQYRKSSFLLDQLGEQVFPPFVHMEEQPHRPRGLGSAPFDGEGVATRPRVLVEDGVLRGYVLNSYAARKLGMQSTGNAGGVHNLVIAPGEQDLQALLRHMGRGLLVTELMGQGVNLVTGDYSRGAGGFWVENGELAYPVQEITIAGNLKTMLRNISAVGADVDRRGNIHTGSLLLEKMTVAGE
jgi:PmbA protein